MPSRRFPVCPRHPDRESYVRCQRCMRPTCPECQRPAAVGIQCVDCVAEGAKTVRQARTVFGGSVTDGRPVATMTIIGICLVVFVAQYAVPGLAGRGSRSCRPWRQSEPWRFLTSAFAHGGITHIAFNMYALWVMGSYLEPMLGRARFVAIYLLSALGGSVMYLLLSTPPTAAESRRATTGCGGPARSAPPARCSACSGRSSCCSAGSAGPRPGMYVIIGINAVIGFVVPGIAWQAHLGGLLTGAAVAAAIAYTGRNRGPLEPPPNQQVHWFSMGGILLVLVVLTLGEVRPGRLSRRAVDYTGVIRPQWGQPLWTTLVRCGRSVSASGWSSGSRRASGRSRRRGSSGRARARGTGARRRCSR